MSYPLWNSCISMTWCKPFPLGPTLMAISFRTFTGFALGPASRTINRSRNKKRNRVDTSLTIEHKKALKINVSY